MFQVFKFKNNDGRVFFQDSQRMPWKSISICQSGDIFRSEWYRKQWRKKSASDSCILWQEIHISDNTVCKSQTDVALNEPKAP